MECVLWEQQVIPQSLPGLCAALTVMSVSAAAAMLLLLYPDCSQGTLYPDVIESCPPPGSGQKHSHTIKSHHNVGGLPKDLQFQLIEPFRELFKDEVRMRGGRGTIKGREATCCGVNLRRGRVPLVDLPALAFDGMRPVGCLSRVKLLPVQACCWLCCCWPFCCWHCCGYCLWRRDETCLGVSSESWVLVGLDQQPAVFLCRCVPLAGCLVCQTRSSSATPSLGQAWVCASWAMSQRVTGWR